MRLLSAFIASFLLLPDAAMPAVKCSVPPVTISHQGSVSPNQNPLTLVFIDTARYPKAICNDGSPAAFIIRKGLNSAANRWIIDLQAGADCYNETTCSARRLADVAGGKLPSLTGTEYWGTPNHPVLSAVDSVMQASNGILSPNSATNPDFWDATQVLALYCSSDDDTGNVTGAGTFAANELASWSFNGHAILTAVMDTLKGSYNLNNATELLFAGSSSGGVGVLLNINGVIGTIPSKARYVALADAGYFDSAIAAFNGSSAVKPYLASSDPTVYQSELEQSYSAWNSSGDTNCINAAHSTNQLENSCRDPSYVMTNGDVQIPTYLAQSDYDTWQLSVINGVSACIIGDDCVPQTLITTHGAVYDSYFASALSNSMLSIPKVAPSAGVIVQSPEHIITSNSLFTQPFQLQSSVQTATVANLFGLWYRNPCATPAPTFTITQYSP